LRCDSGKFTGCDGSFNARINNPCVNYEGETVWDMSLEMKLYSAVVTTLLTDKFYESGTECANKISALIPKVDPVFVAKLAIYARTTMNLRIVPLFLLVELSMVHSGDSLVSQALEKCILRADEIAETLACWQWRNLRRGTKKLKRVPNQIMSALRCAFNKFDEYQFAKYYRAGNTVTLRDALFLAHPKAKDKVQQRLFDSIANDSLAKPYTWETLLSELGRQKFRSEKERQASVKALWEELIDSGKVGYMALLRNLRNILSSGVDNNHIKKVCSRICNPQEVQKSRQLPFRFLSAYYEVEQYFTPLILKLNFIPEPRLPLRPRLQFGIWDKPMEEYERCREEFGKAARSFNSVMSQYQIRRGNAAKEFSLLLEKRTVVLNALEKASEIASSNIRNFCGRTLLACDTSGSMDHKLSNSSKLSLYDVGFVLASMLMNVSSEITTGMFGDVWKIIEFPGSNILANVEAMRRREGEVGYSTNGYKVIEWANKEEQEFNTIIFFTDCQLWNSGSRNNSLPKEWHMYKDRYPEAKLFICDLAGYGNTPIRIEEEDVFYISGWSEKIFDLVGAYSNDEGILSAIHNIEL